MDAEQQTLANIFQTGISEDGKLFFAAGDAGPTGIIRLFDIATGKEARAAGPPQGRMVQLCGLGARRQVPGGRIHS